MGPCFRRDDGEKEFMTAPKSLSRTPPSAIAAPAIVSSLLPVQTRGARFTGLTAEIANFVAAAGPRRGAVARFICPTPARATNTDLASTVAPPSSHNPPPP